MDPAGALMPSIGLIVLSALLHLVRNQAANGQIERNSAIGIRTKQTQRSDDAWLAGHRAASPWLLGTAITGYAAGVMALCVSLAMLASDKTGPAPAVTALAGFVAVISLLILSTIKANAAAALAR